MSRRPPDRIATGGKKIRIICIHYLHRNSPWYASLLIHTNSATQNNYMYIYFSRTAIHIVQSSGSMKLYLVTTVLNNDITQDLCIIHLLVFLDLILNWYCQTRYIYHYVSVSYKYVIQGYRKMIFKLLVY